MQRTVQRIRHDTRTELNMSRTELRRAGLNMSRTELRRAGLNMSRTELRRAGESQVKPVISCAD